MTAVPNLRIRRLERSRVTVRRKLASLRLSSQRRRRKALKVAKLQAA